MAPQNIQIGTDRWQTTNDSRSTQASSTVLRNKILAAPGATVQPPGSLVWYLPGVFQAWLSGTAPHTFLETNIDPRWSLEDQVSVGANLEEWSTRFCPTEVIWSVYCDGSHELLGILEHAVIAPVPPSCPSCARLWRASAKRNGGDPCSPGFAHMKTPGLIWIRKNHSLPDSGLKSSNWLKYLGARTPGYPWFTPQVVWRQAQQTTDETWWNLTFADQGCTSEV